MSTTQPNSGTASLIFMLLPGTTNANKKVNEEEICSGRLLVCI